MVRPLKATTVTPALIALFCLAGCANNDAIRSLAGKAATAAEHYAAATKAFTDAQASAASTDRARIANLKAAAADPAAESALLQRSWVLGDDKKKIEKFAAATSINADGIVASLAPAPADAQPAKRGGVDLKAPIKTLKQMAEQPDLLSQAMFLGEFGQNVSDELDKLRKAAEAEGKAAATEGAAAAEGG